MISIRTSGFGGAPLIDTRKLRFSQGQMRRLGEIGIDAIRDRVAKGLGSNDTPMPALTPGYARRKRRFGQPAIRNLRGEGRGGQHMLDNVSVRAVTSTSFTIDLTSRLARAKALANEQRANWWLFSPQDLQIINAAANDMFDDNITRAMRRVA